MLQLGKEARDLAETRVGIEFFKRAVPLIEASAQEQLAERVTELGLPMNRNVVANIVSGRRSSVSVDEAVAFAMALDVPLPLLLCDPKSEDPVELAPETSVRPWTAVSWLAGTVALSEQDENRWKQNRRHWNIYNRLRKADEGVRTAIGTYEWFAPHKEELGGDLSSQVQWFREAVQRLEAAEAAAAEAGLPTDGFIDPKLAEQIEGLTKRLRLEGRWPETEDV